MSELPISEIGLVLVILGFVIAFVALILLATRSHGSGGKTRAAGVLLIGPIPILFGSDRESVKVLVVLAIILMIVVSVFILLPSLVFNR